VSKDGKASVLSWIQHVELDLSVSEAEYKECLLKHVKMSVQEWNIFQHHLLVALKMFPYWTLSVRRP
jgi:hypothetical protein